MVIGGHIMWSDFILAAKVAGILVIIFIAVAMVACCVVGGRSDRK